MTTVALVGYRRRLIYLSLTGAFPSVIGDECVLHDRNENCLIINGKEFPGCNGARFAAKISTRSNDLNFRLLTKTILQKRMQTQKRNFENIGKFCSNVLYSQKHMVRLSPESSVTRSPYLVRDIDLRLYC
jgi:hypothetical protein